MLGGRSGVHCFWNIPLVPQVRLDYDGREPLYQLAAVQRGTPGFISFKANFTLFRLSRLSCASFFHTFQKGAAAGKPLGGSQSFILDPGLSGLFFGLTA